MSGIFTRFKITFSILLLLFAFAGTMSVLVAHNPQTVHAACTDDPPVPDNPDNVCVNGEEVPPTDDEGQVAEDSCESNGGQFSFLSCELLRLANEGIDELDFRIRRALEVNPDFYEGTSEGDDNNTVRTAWGRMRNIAAVLLIPIMLVLVIGTALGVSALDPYTVRRAMPRLFIAVIFMTLSFDIAVIMIEITSAIGRGVGGLIAGAFGGPENLTLAAIFSPSIGDEIVITSTGILAGIALVGVGAMSISILASYMFTAMMALVIIFAVLTVRELVILFLIILSPLAILSWVFPGNDRLWKIWWDTFTKLLLIYPVIFGLLVMGRVFAWLIGDIPTDGFEAIFIIIAKLTAYIGPFFLILLVLKILTGVFGQVTGFVNDSGKGVFDRSRNFRAKKREDLGQAAKEGRRFNNMPFIGKSKTMRKLSRGTAYMANAPEGLRDIGSLNPRTAYGRYKANMQNTLSNAEHDLAREYEEKNRDFAAIKGDDTKMRAARHSSRAEIEQELINQDAATYGGAENKATREAVVQQILKAQEGASMETFHKARIKALAASGTGYQDEVAVRDENGNIVYQTNEDGSYRRNDDGQLMAETETVFRADQFLEDINHAYGSDRNGAGRAVGELKGVLAASGQLAGNSGFGTLYTQLGNMYDAQQTAAQMRRSGASEEDAQAHYNRVAAEAHQAVMTDAAMSTSAYQAVSIQKPSGARELARVHAGRIEGAAVALQQAEETERNLRNSGTATAEELRAAEVNVARFNDELDASTAAAANLLDTMSHSAPAAIADVFAQELMSRNVSGQTTARPVMVGTGQVDPRTGREVMQPAPATVTVTDSTGATRTVPNPDAATPVQATVRDIIEDRERRARRPVNTGGERGEGAGMRDRRRLAPSYESDIERLQRGE